jgi:NitT/TauT family transport system substrate-binding protein
MWARAALAAGMVLAAGGALAQDRLKVAIGQKGTFENAVAELGQNAGFFKKHNIVLDILYTQGGGETQQAVISGSVDIGGGVGTHGVLGAFGKGAPVRIIGAAMTGASDLFWYVRPDSPIKSIKDAEGKTVAFSTTGSSTHSVVLAFQKQFAPGLKPVATGSPPATFTQAMSGQIDVGGSTAGFGVLQEGKMRRIARGSDVPDFRDQTVRVLIANAGELEKRKDVFARYLQAYREALDWLYADPAAVKAAAEWTGLPEAAIPRLREEFYPKEAISPDKISGLDKIVADAVALKFLSAPLTEAQVKEVVQIPPPLKK